MKLNLILCRITILLAFISLSKYNYAQEITPVFNTVQGKKAFEDLATLYNKDTKPPYAEALIALNSANEINSKNASEYLHALFAQALEDEENGRAPWRQTPYFGGGSECEARKIREEMGPSFGEKASNNKALPIALWLIEKEILPANQAQGFKVIRKIKTDETNALIIGFLKSQNSNREILLQSIEEASLRKLKDAVPHLLAMNHHFRKDIRDAVEKAGTGLAYKSRLEPFNPEKIFNPWLEQEMKNMSAIIYDPIPENKQWVKVEFKNSDYPESSGYMYYGWKLNEDTANIKLLEFSAQTIELPKKYCIVTNSTLKETAEALKTYNDRYRNYINSHEGNTYIPHYTVAAWSYMQGDKKTAAEVLLPLIEGDPDDKWFSLRMRDYFGHLYHNEMLEAYSYQRDYVKAINLTDHLLKPLFREYSYYPRMVSLKKQLTTYPEDFRTFILPSPSAWKTQKEKSSRKDQIIFLADHLRLLNCRQMGQPGGVSYFDDQKDIPFTQLKWNDKDFDKQHEVINPYVELITMNITVAETQYLLPYLSSKTYMPTYDYWRDFAAGRTLHQVSWAVARVINRVTIKDVVDFRHFIQMDSTAQVNRLKEISEWCEKNKDLSEKDIISNILKEDQNWDNFSYAMRRAVAGKHTDLCSLMIAGESFSSPENNNLSEIANYVYQMGCTEGTDAAMKWIEHNSSEVRFTASLILLKQKNKTDKALTTLSEILTEDDGQNFYPKAIEELVKFGSEKSISLAEGILGTNHYTNPDNFWGYESVILRRLFLAKSEKTLNYIISYLNNTEKDENGSVKNEEMIYLINNWKKETWEYDSKWSDEKKKLQVKNISNWLTAQFEKIKKGEAHEIISEFEELNLPQSYIDAP